MTHGLGPAPPPGCGTDGRSRVCVLTLSRDRLLGLGERAFRTEHRVALQLVPAAEVVDSEQVLHGGIRLAVAGLREPRRLVHGEADVALEKAGLGESAAALASGLYPFVPVDLVKICIAAAIMPTVWSLRRKS